VTPEDLIKDGLGVNEEGQFFRLEPTPMPDVGALPPGTPCERCGCTYGATHVHADHDPIAAAAAPRFLTSLQRSAIKTRPFDGYGSAVRQPPAETEEEKRLRVARKIDRIWNWMERFYDKQLVKAVRGQPLPSFDEALAEVRKEFPDLVAEPDQAKVRPWVVYIRLDHWRGQLAAWVLSAAYWSLRKLGGRANVQITVLP